ncbi:hypothetical protein ACFY2H_35690 [Streptomyces griseofuscus]|uniref:hypothetical protein n=1 Tax=Streptomyces griseofuscus TaxID=146922 RepID=UPI0036A86E2F
MSTHHRPHQPAPAARRAPSSGRPRATGLPATHRVQVGPGTPGILRLVRNRMVGWSARTADARAAWRRMRGPARKQIRKTTRHGPGHVPENNQPKQP